MTNASVITPEFLAGIEDVTRLHEIATGLGIPVHHKTGAEKLRAIILTAQQQNNPLVQEEVRTPKAEVLEPYPTQDKIRAEAQKYAEKGMEIRFLDDGLNWHVRCKGAEDTGTTQQPMTEIAKRFLSVSKGAIAPRGIKAGDRVIFTG